MPKPLETIDPATLAQVSGGKAREATSKSGDSDAALTGILGELGALARQSAGSGISSQDVMLLMMMMQQRGAAPAVTPHAPASWTWDAGGGYWIVK